MDLAHRTLSSSCWIVYHVSALVEAKPKLDEKFTKLWTTGGFCLLYFNIWSAQTEEHFEQKKEKAKKNPTISSYWSKL